MENKTTKTEPLTLTDFAENQPDLCDEIRAEGAMKERERIRNIMACDNAKGRMDLTKELAFTTDLAAVEVEQILAHAPMEQVISSFEKAMENTPNPHISPDGDEDESNKLALANRIANY